MARYTFEGVQSGDICLYRSKHMRLPTQIHSLAHRHPPASGTGSIPAMLSPPNTRPRASPGAKPHPSHARTPQPCHLLSSLLPHPSSLRATTTPLTRTFVSPLPRPCPAAASLGTAGLHGLPKFQPRVRREARRSRVLRERGPGTTPPPETGKEISDELHQAGHLPGAMAFFCALTTFFLRKFWEPSDTRMAFPDLQIPSRVGGGLAAPGGSLASPRTLPVSPANASLPSHKTRKPPSSSTSDICSRSKETTKNNYKSVSKKEKEGDSDSRSAGDLCRAPAASPERQAAAAPAFNNGVLPLSPADSSLRFTERCYHASRLWDLARVGALGAPTATLRVGPSPRSGASQRRGPPKPAGTDREAGTPASGSPSDPSGS